MRHATLEESQPGIKIARRSINNLRHADDTNLMEESEEELKDFLMKVKEESEKAGLKFKIKKTKIMASGPITSWQIQGETMERVIDFIFFGRKAMTNLDRVLKSKAITLLTYIHIVKALVFPVVMYRCERQHQRTDAFELCWRRLLRVL